MARSGIQFQKGLSLLEFQRLYGTEELCGVTPIQWTGVRASLCLGRIWKTSPIHARIGL